MNPIARVRRLLRKVVNKILFEATLIISSALTKGSGSYTFTRATAKTIVDFEGVIRPIKNGEIGFDGARRLESLSPRDLLLWSKRAGISITEILDGEYTCVSDGLSDGLVYTYPPESVGNLYVLSFECKSVSGGTQIIGVINTNLLIPETVSKTMTTDWQYFSLNGSVFTNSHIGFNVPSGVCIIRNIVFEDVTDKTYKVASSFSAGFMGDVEYFSTLNANTVLNNVVTKVAGAAIPESTQKGVLIEVSSLNLVLRSNEMLYHWYGDGISRDEKQYLGSDGTLSLTKITESAIDTNHVAYQIIYATVNNTYCTASFEVAKGTASWCAIQTTGAFANSAYFDLALGVVGIINGTTTADIKILPNGNYLCSVTSYLSTPSAQLVPAIYIVRGNGSNLVYLGDTANYLYAGFAMLEYMPFRTSYIPTTTASVTRNADDLSIQTQGNIKASAGTRLFIWTPKHTPVGTFYLFGSFKDANNGVYLFCTDTTLTFRNRVAGVNYDSTITFNYVSGTTYKIAFAWGSKGLQIFVNGVAGTLNPSSLLLQLGTLMYEGCDGATPPLQHCGGNIKLIGINELRLSNQKIITLTAP